MNESIEEEVRFMPRESLLYQRSDSKDVISWSAPPCHMIIFPLCGEETKGERVDGEDEMLKGSRAAAFAIEATLKEEAL